MTRIYKLIDRPSWAAAVAAGRFEGSPVDLADGFIHFSTAAQAGETGRRYFSGQADLLIVAFEAEALGPELRWEPSRGGDLFPHLYAALDPALALETREVVLGSDGAPVLDALQP